MTAYNTREQRKIRHMNPVANSLRLDRVFSNFDSTTGAYTGSVESSVSGTTANAFEVDTDGTKPAIAIGTQQAGTGDYTLTIRPASTLTGNADVIVPDGADTFCMIAATQTLAAKTLTKPTIGDFTNAAHDHSNAANGGTLASIAGLTGTTETSFTINSGGNYAKISTTGLTGDRTYTFPDANGEVVTEGGTQTLTNKTLTSPTTTGLVATTIDINSGSIDGVTIGAASAPTVTNLGAVETCDINGGTIDGTPIGGAEAEAGTFTTATATTFTDGTATITGGDISDVGTLTATTLTDGTASITGGDISSVVTLTATTVTDGKIGRASCRERV